MTLSSGSQNDMWFLVQQNDKVLCLVLIQWKYATPLVCHAYIADAASVDRETYG